VVLVAIEDFAALRDRHGHTVTDGALQSLASALSDGLRPGDTVARVEEDSFLLVLPRTDADGAARVAGRMRDVVAALPVRGEYATLALNAGLGWAATGAIRHSARSLYGAAQESLAANVAGSRPAAMDRSGPGSGRDRGLEVVQTEQSLPV
jgi:diguanylate cyclase (GGDEF)-like protein